MDPYEAWKADRLADRLAAEDAIRRRVAAEEDAKRQYWLREDEKDATQRRVAEAEEYANRRWQARTPYANDRHAYGKSSLTTFQSCLILIAGIVLVVILMLVIVAIGSIPINIP